MRTKFRHLIQAASAALFNGYLLGFKKGTIYQGKTKMLCVPVLNCYSCPGALGACPIGSLQAVLGDWKCQFSFYVLGLMMLFGMSGGRIICGLLCPFGLIQDLLYYIKVPKWKVPEKPDRLLRYLKYGIPLVLLNAAMKRTIGRLFFWKMGILIVIVLLSVFIYRPFCKYLCPLGHFTAALTG